jgi:beta-glucosidase/6-phospho-beta-glucosidase/beta-galactosidase
MYFKLFLSFVFILSANAKELNFNKYPSMLFGIASAPGHVEDQLDDMWLEFAENGGVRAFYNHAIPEQRLKFWSEPEVELDWLKKSGAKLFRLGVDWGRLTNKTYSARCFKKRKCQISLDREVLAHYKKIIKMARDRGLKIMLTLLHHSEPRWALINGGLKNKKVRKHFEKFAIQVFNEMSNFVDYWITLNEPTLYGVLTQMAGLWPSSTAKPGPWQLVGGFRKLQNQLIKAHKNIYHQMKKISPEAKIGIAKRIDFYYGDNFISNIFAGLSNSQFNYHFLDKTINAMDFIGINYYGIENVKGLGISFNPKIEYTEAGRGIYPTGLKLMLKKLNQKYNQGRQLPFIITENGIADALDTLRPAYLAEHLAALYSAMEEGIKVEAYVFWTLSDNLEWADGYCPKFGLLSVDRDNGLKRTPRPSFFLFQTIATKRFLSLEQREKAWKTYQLSWGSQRPFCRTEDAVHALDYPSNKIIEGIDWRFKQASQKTD